MLHALCPPPHQQLVERGRVDNAGLAAVAGVGGRGFVQVGLLAPMRGWISLQVL